MKISLLEKALVLLVLTVFVAMVLFPVVWMLSSSFKEEEEIYQIPPTFFPSRAILLHYREIFSRFKFQKYLPNSALIALSTTVLSVSLGGLAAYGFARFHFRHATLLLFIVLVVRLFTPAALVVPLYDMMKWLGLIDTKLAIIIGVTIMNLPFVVWIMKVFLDDFPGELEDAAKLDGMNAMRIFWSIILPLAAPTVATVALFAFNYGWNDLLFSLSFSQTDRAITSSVGIASMNTAYKVYWGAMMAGGTVMSVPVIIIAFILQKYFVKGITMGAIK